MLHLLRLVLFSAASIPTQKPSDLLQSLPNGWKLERSVEVPTTQLSGFSKKLGGDVTALANHILSANGKRLQVNRITCKSNADADRVHQAILKLKNNLQDSVLKRDREVIEFVCDDLRIVRRAHYELGLKPRRVTYSISFDAAPIDRADYMQWNNLYNAFVKAESNPRAVAELAGKFQFGRHLTVRDYGQGSAKSTFQFDPKPAEQTPIAGERTKVRFDKLPTRHQVPIVAVSATVTSEAFATTPSSRRSPGELTAATEFWPVDDPLIKSIAEQLTAGKKTDSEKVDAILDWMLPGRNFNYGGAVIGSRYGVKTMLEQKTGRCWDFSDVFITLCRSASVPARQVVGWLYPRDGHVWAEVLLDGTAWQPIDPTAGMGCNTDYVPFFTSEDGHLSIVYTGPVRIQPVSDGKDAK